MILPPGAHPLVQVLALHFTRPTYQRLPTPTAAALVTAGRRTAAHRLRALRHPSPGHRTAYRRVPSRAPWSGRALGCAPMRFVLVHLLPDGPAVLAGDDTVDGHKGPCVYAGARRRDAVRSSHSHTAWRHDHEWVVLAALVEFPSATRPRAWPVLVDRYRSEGDDRARDRPHRTPARVMRVLPRLLPIRPPNRTSVSAGDAGYGTHEVARLRYGRRNRLALVSESHPDANLFDPPPPYAGEGRPRVEGARLPKPRRAVDGAAPLTPLAVGWYGGGRGPVGTRTGTGHGYEAGHGPVALRRVFVRDATGTHRDEDFLTTDAGPSASAVIAAYCGRRNIEATFREARGGRGPETTRGWRETTVLRAAPCPFGSYTVVAIRYAAPPASKRTGPVARPGRTVTTSSDARAAVRRRLWAEALPPQTRRAMGLEKLPGSVRERLLTTLAPAA